MIFLLLINTYYRLLSLANQYNYHVLHKVTYVTHSHLGVVYLQDYCKVTRRLVWPRARRGRKPPNYWKVPQFPEEFDEERNNQRVSSFLPNCLGPLGFNVPSKEQKHLKALLKPRVVVGL